MDGDKIISFSRTELKEAQEKSERRESGIVFDEKNNRISLNGKTIRSPEMFKPIEGETHNQRADRLTMLTAEAMNLVLEGADVADAYLVLSKVVTGLISTTGKEGCKRILRDTFIMALNHDVDLLIEKDGE